ncbi:MAG: ABC transporter ATP-binding protein [Actinomycetota bacterium]|nr:ABC transporter ATP-binding protein [Actinomycetota bacterium]
MPGVIEVRGLTHRYGRRVAVEDVSFCVARGEVLGLLGRNGAGKTTTIEIVEGYRRPTAGLVRVLGRDPFGGDRHLRSRIGVVLQSGATEPTLRVRELLALHAGFYHPRRRVSDLIAAVGLEGEERTVVGSLSGGQHRRLELALALAGDPEVLFLDEPTTGLDPEGRRQIWAVVTSLRARGAAILLTSHYLEEVEVLADEVVVMQRGKVLVTGSPDALRSAAPLGTSEIAFRTRPHVALPEGPWVVEVTRGGRSVLTTREPLAAIEQLAAWARHHGIDIEQLELRRPSLEDAYLQLTAEP